MWSFRHPAEQMVGPSSNLAGARSERRVRSEGWSSWARHDSMRPRHASPGNPHTTEDLPASADVTSNSPVCFDGNVLVAVGANEQPQSNPVANLMISTSATA